LTVIPSALDTPMEIGDQNGLYTHAVNCKQKTITKAGIEQIDTYVLCLPYKKNAHLCTVHNV